MTTIRSLTSAAGAMADPSRVRMLKYLERGETCVCHVQAFIGLAQPTVSRHLKVLEQAGLVKSRKKGTWVYYRLNEEAGEAAAALLSLARSVPWDGGNADHATGCCAAPGGPRPTPASGRVAGTSSDDSPPAPGKPGPNASRGLHETG